MATNKLAILRYQVLDKCFANIGRKYFIEDLIEACNKAIYDFTGKEIGIKKRQVLEDIKFMESSQGWSIPLDRIREGHKVYFRYDDKNFSINNKSLNETETQQLKEALLTLSIFKGLPHFEWVEEITTRIDSELSLTNSVKNVIEFEQNNYLKGLHFITPIYNAIINEYVIEVQYKSFKIDDIQTFQIHPYFLKQFNNRWFMFGLNDFSKYIINLALDRIISINESAIKYTANEEIDFNEYFEDVVGVSLNTTSKVQKIVLAVANNIIPYIVTKPLHGSQKIKERQEQNTIVSLDLIPNYELESLLLSYGEGIEVIEPIELRKKITERINQLNQKYSQ
jgi:predicted DNA-binding transcriptional regulator YafY